MRPLKVVVLLSGGLDSLLSLAELVAKPTAEVERVYALVFDYGQSSSAEIASAVAVCEAWGVPYRVASIATGATDTRQEIPARNLIFISHSAAVVRELGFNCIAIGAEPDSTYTDSSIEFLAQCNKLLGLFDISLIAPVKPLQNKLALVRRALDLGVPLHLCHSSRSNAVDGACKTSRLFLSTFDQIFPSGFMPATEILAELAQLQCEHDQVRNIARVRYTNGASFKYPAALFSVLGDPFFFDDLYPAKPLAIYSTGSWMRDMQRVLELPSIKAKCSLQVSYIATHSLYNLLNQQVNCASRLAHWGMAQAMSMLRRPRYARHIACRITQGHLAKTLEELGYIVELPARRTGLLLETEPKEQP